MKVEEVGLDGVPLMAASDREICEETPTILQNLENTNAKRNNLTTNADEIVWQGCVIEQSSLKIFFRIPSLFSFYTAFTVCCFFES